MFSFNSEDFDVKKKGLKMLSFVLGLLNEILIVKLGNLYARERDGWYTWSFVFQAENWVLASKKIFPRVKNNLGG